MSYTHILNTDGACHGNPGPSGAGAVLYDLQENEVDTLSEGLPELTNNEAEYEALERGLAMAARNGVKRLCVRMDSMLVVQQVTGVWRCNYAHLQAYIDRIQPYVQEHFDHVEFTHVKRHLNIRADQLAGEAVP